MLGTAGSFAIALETVLKRKMVYASLMLGPELEGRRSYLIYVPGATLPKGSVMIEEDFFDVVNYIYNETGGDGWIAKMAEYIEMVEEVNLDLQQNM